MSSCVFVFCDRKKCVAIRQELNISRLEIANCEVAFRYVVFSVYGNIIRLATVMGLTLNGLYNREWSIGRKRVDLGGDTELRCVCAPRFVDVQLWDSGTPRFRNIAAVCYC